MLVVTKIYKIPYHNQLLQFFTHEIEAMFGFLWCASKKVIIIYRISILDILKHY